MKKVFFIVAFLSLACTQKTQIAVNQIGFYPEQEKIAVLEGAFTGTFQLVEETSGKTVFEGTAGEISPAAFSGTLCTGLDFSAFENPGTYRILTSNGIRSHVFAIDRQVLIPLALAALNAFTLQRSTPGHPDTAVLVHASAATESRPEGALISSPGGWYDAGDYNKYIVNASYTTGMILAGVEKYGGYVNNASVKDEALYNLKWALTMQDPVDGGVYHKLTTPEFEGFIPPEACEKPRYVIQKSVTATLDFAASMAQGARVYRQTDWGRPIAVEMVQAAEAAFAWALENPDCFYNQWLLNKNYIPAIQTGAYSDNHAEDEFFWAAAELYLTTGKEKYYQTLLEYAPELFTAPVWSNVAGLGIFSLLTHGKATEAMKEQLIAFCDSVSSLSQGAAYVASFGNNKEDFHWGSLSEKCCANAISLLYGYELTQEKKYLVHAFHNMDYLLGRNPTGYCFVTGMGTKSPRNPHHRLAATDDLPGPLPGFLVGGPNWGKQDGCNYPSPWPDRSYLDIVESYASNEIAINWNATLLHLAVALDSFSSW
ncbi:MAG: glycosyl hydrolase family 9 [Bacteroidales bacterium]|nr:glycosyl hydrolase family 9 [Bacteroidales bacterium]